MEKLESIIFGLKAEVERLQGERNKYKELYETMYRKWSELSDKEFNCQALRKEKNEYFDKAVELQKKVDELENIGCHFNCPLIDFPDFECEKLIKERAVKDTAKEIYEEIDKSDILIVQTQEYGEIEVVPIERLKEIIKQKGVEVE